MSGAITSLDVTAVLPIAELHGATDREATLSALAAIEDGAFAGIAKQKRKPD